MRSPGDNPPYQQVLRIPFKLPSMNDWVAWAKEYTWQYSRKCKRRVRLYTYATQKRDLQEAIGWEIKRWRLRPVKKAELFFEWQETERGQERDPDNVRAGGTKVILDALVACRILPTDKRHSVLKMTDSYVWDASTQGVTVIIREV